MTYRIIPIILLDGIKAVVTHQFTSPTYVGDPRTLAKIYSDQGADEIFVLQINPSFNISDNLNFLASISKFTQCCVAYGGNLSTIRDVSSIISAGFEKVIFRRLFFNNPSLVRQVSLIYGSQAVTICLDIVHLLDEVRFGVFDQYSEKYLTLDQIYELQYCDYFSELLLNSTLADGSFNVDSWASSFIHEFSKPIIYAGGISSPKQINHLFSRGYDAVGLGAEFAFSAHNTSAVMPSLTHIYNKI